MDSSNYIYNYVYHVKRFDRKRPDFDLPLPIGSDEFRFTKFRCVTLEVDQPHLIQNLVYSFMQKFFHQNEDPSLKSCPSDFEPTVPLDEQCQLSHKITEVATALLAQANDDAKNHHGRTIHIAVDLTIRRTIKKDEAEKACLICLENIRNHYDVTSLRFCRCKQLFHGECIRRWLEKSRTCPLCRVDIDKARDEALQASLLQTPRST